MTDTVNWKSPQTRLEVNKDEQGRDSEPKLVEQRWHERES